MKYSFKQSYVHSLKKLDKKRAEKVHSAFEQLVHLFETGEKTSGLGLKKLRFGFWEARAGLMDRIIFRRKADTIEFILAGNHTEIKNFLKDI